MAPSLISTTTFPGDDMSPEAIGAGASMLRFVGDQVAGDAADVVRTWSTISGSYDAPEAGQLVAAMTPVKTSGDTFDSHLGSAADALVTFADEVRTIKKTLEGIRGEANALLATIDGNGKVGAGGIGPGSDWYHDPVTFHHNEELIAAVAAQAALLKAAEAKCGGAIASLVDGGGRRGENGGPGFSTVSAPAVQDAPWGHVMTGQEMNEQWEREAPGWERGASKQAMATAAGVLSYVGFDTSQFDPSSGLPHGPLSTGWSLHNAATTWEATSQLLFHHPLKALGGAFKDFTAWDDWADRPGFAAGEVGFNLLTLGLASAKVGSVGRLGGAGREAADAAAGAGKLAGETAEASRLAKLAGSAQRAAERVTVRTVDGLRAAARTGSEAWSKTIDRLHKLVERSDFNIEKASTTHPQVPDANDALKDHAEPATSQSGPPVDPHAGSGDDSGSAHSGSAHSGSADQRDGTKPDPASGTQHVDEELKGQHRFSDVNSTAVDPLHHVVHDEGWEFKPEHPMMIGPGLHDVRTVRQIQHLDALHHRNALARTMGVDTKKLSVKELDNTLAKLEKQATTPAELRQVRDLGDASFDEYDTNRKLHKISERMGTEAGKAFHKSEGEELIAGDHDRPGRRNELDTVGVNKARTVLDVVEEKGGTARLGTRKLDSGVKVEQGSTAYLNKMLHIDPEILDHFKRHPEDVQRLIDGEMELRYHVLRAKPDGTIWIERMKLNPDELHFEDLLPAPALPTPVLQPR